MLNISIVLAEAYDIKAGQTHSLNSIETQNQTSDADVVTAEMDA